MTQQTEVNKNPSEAVAKLLHKKLERYDWLTSVGVAQEPVEIGGTKDVLIVYVDTTNTSIDKIVKIVPKEFSAGPWKLKASWDVKIKKLSKPVPAHTDNVKPDIKFGELREKVKKGTYQAKDVLAWLVDQPGPHSPKLLKWLRNYQPGRNKKAEEAEKQAVERGVDNAKKQINKWSRPPRSRQRGGK